VAPPKQTGVAILISDKVDFNLTLIKIDKEGHYILIKGEIHQKKNYQPICTQHQCTQFHQTYSEGPKTYINSNTVVVGDFNIHLSPMDRSSKQKINKEILELNHTIDQMDLVFCMSTEYFTQLLHNVHSSQQPMKPSPKLIIY
jgi:hypothetical protein